MSWLTGLSLVNRSIVGLAVVAAILFGAFAITSLKEELMPDLTFPYVTVFAVAPGISASDVERSVTTPLEHAIKTTSGIKEYDSFSNDGMSIITIEYEFGTDIDAKQTELQQAISTVRNLPQSVQPPEVAALNFGSMPVMQLAVSSTLPPQELAGLLNTQVVPRLQEIPGVQAVTLSGVQEMQLQIRLRPAVVARFGVTPQAIATAVQQANLTAGAGTIASGSLVYPVTVSASAQTVTALGRVVIAPSTATGSPVTLGELADLRIAPAPPSAITRTNGKPTIGISVSKASSGNTIDIADAIAEKLPEIADNLGGQATITTVIDQSLYIRESITSLWQEGLLGAAFAVLTIWVFLRSWRSTLIASLSIPLSVLGALIVLWSRGESLNMLTLGGLTIAIGRVIDDSIVVIENAYRHLQEGDDPRTAAYTATREVAGAITASTLTTVAVFLPLGFVHGLASEFFRPFALTVTFALLASLLVALTVVPVVASWLLTKHHVGHRDPDEITRLQHAYLPVLRLALDHKAVTMILAAAVFAATMVATPLLKTNLFDNSAQNTMTITQQMPAGTSLAATMTAAEKVETVLAATQGVNVFQVTAGATGSLFGPGGGVSASSSQAAFSVLTDPEAEKNAVLDEVRSQIAELEDAGSIAVSGEDGGSSMGSMSTMEVRVSAADPAVLREANALVLARMKTVEGLTDVRSNLSDGRPSVVIIVDQAKAAAAGVSPATLSQYTTLILNGYPLGIVPTTTGPLMAQVVMPGISAPPIPGAVSALLAKIPVPGSQGMVPLGTIARVEEVQAPVRVTHIDGERTASITANASDNNIGAASTAVTEALDKVKLPAGATWGLAGATQMSNDVFRTLGVAMLIAILLVYIIMVVAFHSLLNPLILLVSIPFAAVGAVLLMLATGTSLGMPSLVGLLMLIGIVVTNAIVLLDLIEQFRRQGMDARSAVIEGGRRRLRPILMTAIATILALLPMALGMGKAGFLSAPLAMVVIGGLLTSTLLTLVLVPVLYLAFDRLHPRNAVPAAADDVAAETEPAPG